MGLNEGLLISLMIEVLLVSRTQGAARFTVVPPSVLYVSVGETAKLVWDYSVDNRIEEFDVSSPMWMFYADNGSAFLIGQENVFIKWKWSINTKTCPARLLNPVRVSKESTATLVIHNVTLADSGTYGCVLVRAARSPITSKVKLVVTSFPNIKLNPASSNIPINESQALSINCSAAGVPIPNVTWQKDKVMNQGVGKVTVKITNITREDSGMYNCCATNNPNKPPVCKSTLVSVQYKPEIDVIQSNSTLSSYDGGTIILYCLARGVPSLLFTWYDPSNRSLSTGLENVTGGSLLKIVNISKDSYGLFRCKAENILGYDEHFINVTQTVLPTTKGMPKTTRSYAETSTSTVTQAHTSERQEKVSTKALSTPTVQQVLASTSDSGQVKSISKDTILLTAGGTVIFILLTTIVILTVMIFKKCRKNKDIKGQQDDNEVPSSSPEIEDNGMPIYAIVDLSKKKRNRKEEDHMPINAQHPDHVIYAELDDLESTEVIPAIISPPLPDRDAYAEIASTGQNTSNDLNTDPIYEAIPLE